MWNIVEEVMDRTKDTEIESTKRKRGRPKKTDTDVVDVVQKCPGTENERRARKVGRPRKVLVKSPLPLEDPPPSHADPNPISSVAVTSKSRSLRSKKLNWARVVGDTVREIIPSQRLPTNRIVLQRYHTLKNEYPLRTDVNILAERLYGEVLTIWERAGIPTVEKKTCLLRLVRLLCSWKTENCRMLKEGSDKELNYIKMLDSLFKMGHIENGKVKEDLKAKRLLQKDSDTEYPGKKIYEIDFEFYEGQLKNPQEGSIAGKDVDLAKRKKVQMEKMMQQEQRKKNDAGRALEGRQVASTEELDSIVGVQEEESVSDPENDPDYVPYHSNRKPKKLSKVMLELPTKDLTKETAVIADRLKLSHRAAISLFAKIILSAGGELKDFVLSKSSSYRHRILAEKDAERKLNIKYECLSAASPYGILHFDGKKVKFESGEVEEHLIICLQQVASGSQGRFLGAPQLPDGTGAAQCEALVRYIDENGIENQLIGHCWDTTSANTGCNSGAAVLLDKHCDAAHLWIACRRHAGERHCVHANDIVRGPTKSPEEKLFKHFKENFHFLDTTQLQRYQWIGDENSPTGPYHFSTEMAMDVRSWAEACCIHGTFPREDYRELLELLTFALGGTIRRKLLRGVKVVEFRMQLPGAYDHVRFMAKAIYYVKMFLLLPQLIERNLVDEIGVSVISRMSQFVILLYGRYFLETALTSSAPRLDLQFWRNAKRYEHVLFRLGCI